MLNNAARQVRKMGNIFNFVNNKKMFNIFYLRSYLFYKKKSYDTKLCENIEF